MLGIELVAGMKPCALNDIGSIVPTSLGSKHSTKMRSFIPNLLGHGLWVGLVPQQTAGCHLRCPTFREAAFCSNPPVHPYHEDLQNTDRNE